MTRRDVLAIAVLVAAFAVAVVIVNPRGNFPLDDDWDFAFGAWTLAKFGVIQHTPFTVAIAVLQYCWGAAWTLAFGQSFTVLRFSTLFLSLGTVVLLFLALRRAGIALNIALFAALALLFHPLYFWSSFTFMTHVPELFLSIAALAFLVEAERRDSNGALIAAATTAFASCLVRQTGILNIIAPLVAAIIFRRSLGARWRKVAWAYGAAAVAVAVLAASGGFFVENQETAIHLGSEWHWDELILGPLHYGFFNVQYAALCFAPLVLAALTIRLPRYALIGFGLWFVAIAARMIALRAPLPYPTQGHVFVNFTLGPPTLRDTFIYGRPYPFHAGLPWLILLMVVTTALAIFLAALIARNVGPGLPFLASFAAIYCLCGTAVHMFQRLYFDRYSIDTMWPVAILIPLSITRVPKVAFATLAIVAFFAITGTAEYLSWNRARWTAYAWLRSRGVTLDQMDGGYEINAALAVQRGRKNLGTRGFGVVDDQYILTFDDVPGRRTIATFPYRRLLGADGEVRVLAR
ncbi:MAG TPA: glycosyltransferase family 39 protein [Thermoanaerobaculia bacterium]